MLFFNTNEMALRIVIVIIYWVAMVITAASIAMVIKDFLYHGNLTSSVPFIVGVISTIALAVTAVVKDKV